MDNFRAKSEVFLLKPASASLTEQTLEQRNPTYLPSKKRKLSDFANPSQLINQVVRFEDWGRDYLIEDIQSEGNQFKLRARTADSSAKALSILVDESTEIFPGVVRGKALDQRGRLRSTGYYLGQMVTLRISSDESDRPASSSSLQTVHAIEGQVISQGEEYFELRKSDGQIVKVRLDGSKTVEVVEWKRWGPTQER